MNREATQMRESPNYDRLDIGLWRMAWELLTKRERRYSLLVLAITSFSAVFSVVMIGSVMPFLAVLSEPARIDEIGVLSWTYDLLGFDNSFDFLLFLGLASLLVIVVAMFVQILKLYAIARFSTMRMHSLSCRLMSRYLGQPYEYFLNRHSDSMGTRILAETQQFVTLFLHPAAELVAALQTVTLIVLFLMWVNPLLTLLAFSIFGAAYAITFLLSRPRLRKLGSIRLAANTQRFRVAGEVFEGTKDIKVVGREGSYLSDFRKSSKTMARAWVTIQMYGGLPKHVVQAVGAGGIIVLCLFLLEPEALENGNAVAGLLPLLGVFAFAGQRLSPELSKIYQSLVRLSTARPVIEAIHNDLLLLPRGDTVATGQKRLGLTSELVLENVSFSYPNARRASIEGVAFSIKAGDRIGIVGETGSGKTTLVDLILGLLSANSGRILIDGTELNAKTLGAWQKTVGYVPQSIFLSDTSIAENIALGVPKDEIDYDRIIHAGEVAQLDRFILDQLSDGYETVIGERGVRLSGGQRQRLGIARAIYNNADLIVFDEATSALDNLTELEVMNAIKRLPGDKTIIIIAHRLSTVEFCENIAVLEGGRMVGFGKWDDLKAGSARFKTMLNPTPAPLALN